MFSRTSSNGRPMFGSQLENHLTCVRLSISNAVVYQADGEPERYLDSDQLIVVEFTADQYANLLSTQNICPGTPCTVVRYNGKKVETPPVRKTNMHRIRSDFRKKMKSLMGEVVQAEKDFSAMVYESQKPLGKGKQRELLAQFGRFRNLLMDSLPFTLDMFHEATQETVQVARQEISSAMQTMVHQAGIRSLEEKQLMPPAEATIEPLQLAESSEGNS